MPELDGPGPTSDLPMSKVPASGRPGSARVLLSAARDAQAPAAGDEPYSFWGYTAHFEIYLAHDLPSYGVLAASGFADICEADYAQLKDLFGGITPDDLPFQIHARPGDSGAVHGSCGDTSIYCDIPTGDGTYLAYLAASEAVEVFEDAQARGWWCGFSHGEGLSRILAWNLHPHPHHDRGYVTAPDWLNSPRKDYVSSPYADDQHFPSTGCSALFLTYLKYQLGWSWALITEVGCNYPLTPGPSLANTFRMLTGREDAFASFKSVYERRFPYGVLAELDTDNPFPIRPDLVFYDPADGVGQFYASNMAGDIALIDTHTDWRTTWTSIVPLYFTRSRAADLLFYNANAGRAELYLTDGKGALKPMLRHYEDWRTTWSMILPTNITGGGYSDLLFYDRAAGIGEFYHVDQHGGITLLSQHTDWLTTWKLIVPGNFTRAAGDSLLFYEANDGVLEVWTVDTHGNVAFKNSNPTRHTWTSILALNVTGGLFSDVLMYDATNGTAVLCVTDGEGILTPIRSYAGWRTNWSVICSPSFGQLMFYSAESGVGQFYAIDTAGTMTLQRTYTDWKTTWSQIHPGNFLAQAPPPSAPFPHAARTAGLKPAQW